MASGPWGARTCRTFSRASLARSRSSAPPRPTRKAHRITVPRSTSTRRAWWSGRSSFPERWSGTSSSRDGGRGMRDGWHRNSTRPASPIPRPASGRFLSRMPNLLATEPSAYLKSAAHQPVHWHPWGDAAFTRARTEDKPILLDIGAVWCHWCHVMDGESYEDARVADLLNADFVCIKVDRDERPDVDARYQRAVQALTGQGGWPLTAFLTPEGEVFYGGTYFPPEENHYGRAGFPSVLRQVAGIYRQQRDKVTEHARAIRDHVAKSLDEAQGGDVSPATVARGTVDWVLEVLSDRERGAFFTSQDADVRFGDDGDYWTWTVDELKAALPEQAFPVARRVFDVEEQGEMHHNPRKNVLWWKSDPAGDDEWPLLERALGQLKAARDRRPAPFVDTTAYVNWNAMMASAFLHAGAVLDRPDCNALALKVLERIWSEAWDEGGGMGHVIDGAEARGL